MLKSRGWAGLRWTLATLSLCTLLTRAAPADAIDSTLEATATPVPAEPVKSDMVYGTSGSIGMTGITGANVISFVPEAAGAFTSPSAFSLGTFVVGYLPPGQTTTYDHTPFSITYAALKVNDEEPMPNQSPITVSGFLNGTVTGPTQSDVVATFSPVANPTFLTGDYINKLSVLDPQVSLVPSTTNGGRTTAQAHIQVSAAPIPEPTTIALFATTIVGLGLRRRLVRRLHATS
jgi:hypothetical protein